MNLNQKRRDAALAKELLAVEKLEKKMEQAALKAKPATWKKELESRIPVWRVRSAKASVWCLTRAESSSKRVITKRICRLTMPSGISP